MFEAWRSLHYACGSGIEDGQRLGPRGRKCFGVEPAAGGPAPRWVEHDQGAFEVDRRADGVSNDHAGGWDVGLCQEGNGGRAFAGKGWHVCVRERSKVAAESAGEVGHGKAEQCHPPGPPVCHERVSHHLQAIAGEQPRGRVFEPARRPGAERHLFSKRRSFLGSVVAPEFGGEPIYREGGHACWQRRKGIASSARYQVAGASDVHRSSLRQSPAARP